MTHVPYSRRAHGPFPVTSQRYAKLPKIFITDDVGKQWFGFLNGDTPLPIATHDITPEEEAIAAAGRAEMDAIASRIQRTQTKRQQLLREAADAVANGRSLEPRKLSLLLILSGGEHGLSDAEFDALVGR